MPGATVDSGHGITIVFGTSGFSAELTDVNFSGMSREAIKTTHMETAAGNGTTTFGGHTFIPADLGDPGGMDIEYNFDPSKVPPIDRAAETITVTFPLASGDSTAAKWAGTGFMTGYEAACPEEDRMVSSATLKFSGLLTYTAAT